MGENRRRWMERITGWGTALAVPLVAVIGLKLLISAHDPASHSGPDEHRSNPTPGRVFAPPIDASAPPVVELHATARSDADQDGPRADAAARCRALLREASTSARIEAQRLHCPGR